MSDKIFHYAAYMRLSREDGDGGESGGYGLSGARLLGPGRALLAQ